MASRKKQQKLEQTFRRLKQELVSVEADEERRVRQAIAPDAEKHQKILARSRESEGYRTVIRRSSDEVRECMQEFGAAALRLGIGRFHDLP